MESSSHLSRLRSLLTIGLPNPSIICTSQKNPRCPPTHEVHLLCKNSFIVLRLWRFHLFLLNPCLSHSPHQGPCLPVLCHLLPPASLTGYCPLCSPHGSVLQVCGFPPLPKRKRNRVRQTTLHPTSTWSVLSSGLSTKLQIVFLSVSLPASQGSFMTL